MNIDFGRFPVPVPPLLVEKETNSHHPKVHCKSIPMQNGFQNISGLERYIYSYVEPLSLCFCPRVH